MPLDNEKVKEYVEERWSADIESTLMDYIRVPNLSPLFDAEWETNGHMEAAVDVLVKWVKAQAVAGLSLEVIKEAGRTPLIFIEVAATGGADGVVLQYGHLDKQPHMTDTWREGLGPCKPVLSEHAAIKGGPVKKWLYGRGGADDGYSVFAAVTAIKALQEQNVPHARNVILIEASEESGSPDLPHYVSKLKERIGEIDLVLCLDSGCGDYDHLWLTTSLRGLVAGVLKVEILTEGCHSGLSSGIVPSSFRIARDLLSRIEDPETGEIVVPELKCEIPEERVADAKVAAGILGDTVHSEFPWAGDASRAGADNADLLLNRTWRAALSVTGVDGMPPLETAGNVLRTHTSLMLSMRLPPTVDGKEAARAMERELTRDSPYGAKVTFTCNKTANGWNATASPAWLKDATERASNTYFGAPPQKIGEGGSIPFLNPLGDTFPGAGFAVLGILGPGSNAHGPNEKLCITMCKSLIASIAVILDAHASRNDKRARE